MAGGTHGGVRENCFLIDRGNPLLVLNEKQKRFAMFFAEGKAAMTAAKLAGYKEDPRNVNRTLTTNPKIQAAVRYLQKKYENSIVASRKQVLEGFLYAIEQAKLMSDPAVQIAGWREIGKMCGYYAPEVKEVNITLGQKRVIGQLEVLSDAELLELIETDEETLEGEAVEVLSHVPEPELEQRV